MKLIRNAFAAGLVAAISVAACSSQQATPSGNPNGSPIGTTGSNANLGSVGMHLQIANGVLLQNLTWTISGSGLPTYNGTVPIGDAQSIEFVAGGIQAGGPYTITLSGSDSQNDPCTGSTTFTITAGQTSSAGVNITCTQPADASIAADVTTGNLAIEAGVTVITASAYHCPGITGVSVDPAEILPPQTAALDVTTTVVPGGTPGTATISWVASGGTFADTGTSTSSLAAPTYVCPAVATTTVYAVTVTIGLTGSNNGVDAGDVCATAPYQTITQNITCEAGGQLICTSPTPNQCGTGSSEICTNTSSDPNNCGTCGTVCPSVQSCTSGVCSCPSGESLCSGACVSLTTTSNCGTCGNVCATGDSCTAGVCKAPPPTICTSGTCGANNITCPNQTGGVCDQTDAIIINRDIAKGITTAAGSAKVTGSCFACLLSGSCIDYPAQHVTGNDCDDLGTAVFTPGTGSAGPGETLCGNVLSCITGSAGASCAENAEGETYCYCGSEGGTTSSACSSASTYPLNGSCESQELNGFTYTSNSALVTNFDDTTQPSGVANQIIACAAANSCTMCY